MGQPPSANLQKFLKVGQLDRVQAASSRLARPMFKLVRSADRVYSSGCSRGGVIGVSLPGVPGLERYWRFVPAHHSRVIEHTMADLSSIIRDAAHRYGLSPEMMLRIAQLESGLNPNAANPNSSARGVFQFLTKPGGSWDQYGRGQDPLDPAANADAAARFTKDNMNLLRTKLGREPAPWEVYLTHQQGSAGGPALLQNPNRPATEVLQAFYKDPTAPITANAGRANMTAGEFADLWRAKYEGSAPGVGKTGGSAPGAVAGLVEPPVLRAPNPAALAYGPQNLLGSIFADATAQLKQPEQPQIRKSARVSALADGLGAPVRLSS